MRSIRWLGKGAAALVATALLVGAVGTPAEAVYREDTNTSSGNVYYYKVDGRADRVLIHGPYVWRSPATTGIQRVWVQYMILRHDGTALPGATYSRDIGATEQGKWMLSYSQSVIGYKFPNQFTGFQVYMIVTWGTTNGGFIARSVYSYDEFGDYRCVPVSEFCWASDALYLI